MPGTDKTCCHSFSGLSRYAAAVLFACCLFSACQREAIEPVRPDDIPPLPPAGLVVEESHDGFVFLGWLKNTESDLRAYVVSRSEPASGFEVIDTTTRNFYIDGGRSYDTTYSYRVTAIDQSGNESAPSTIVFAQSPNQDAPDTPSDLLAEGQHVENRRFIRLTWTPSAAYDLKEYQIHRSLTPAVDVSPSSRIAVVDRPYFEDSGVTEGPMYYYAVVSVDRGGLISPPGSGSGDRVTALPVQTDPHDGAVVRGGYPDFTWMRVPGAVEYLLTISQSPVSDVLWSVRVTDDGSATYRQPYEGPTLSYGRAYYWRVATVTRTGGGPNAFSSPFLFQLAP